MVAIDSDPKPNGQYSDGRTKSVKLTIFTPASLIHLGIVSASSSSLYASLEVLHEQGLITVKPDPRSKRSYACSITDDGIRCFTCHLAREANDPSLVPENTRAGCILEGLRFHLPGFTG